MSKKFRFTTSVEFIIDGCERHEATVMNVYVDGVEWSRVWWR